MKKLKHLKDIYHFPKNNIDNNICLYNYKVKIFFLI